MDFPYFFLSNYFKKINLNFFLMKHKIVSQKTLFMYYLFAFHPQ